MTRLVVGWALVPVAVALMGWSLAVGFFDFELLRYGGGLVGFVLLLTAIDLIRDDPDPWWTGGKSSFHR